LKKRGYINEAGEVSSMNLFPLLLRGEGGAEGGGYRVRWRGEKYFLRRFL
jgi:hypothetical protein